MGLPDVTRSHAGLTSLLTRFLPSFSVILGGFFFFFSPSFAEISGQPHHGDTGVLAGPERHAARRRLGVVGWPIPLYLVRFQANYRPKTAFFPLV